MAARILVIVTLACLTSARLATAEVVDASPSGFTVRHAGSVTAPAMQAYRAVVERVSAWWSSDHTWSGEAANLSIDARPGGCFCEALPGGGVRHMTVIFARPGDTLRMTGALGPMQEMAVIGTMTWRFTEQAGTTAVELTYRVGGYAPGGVESLAKPVDGVMGQQFQRALRYIATGRVE